MQRELGAVIEGWSQPERPGPAVMAGRFVRLERLDGAGHGADLSLAFAGDASLYDYLFSGPFATDAAFQRWIRDCAANPDFVYYAIRDLKTGLCTGMASYLRIDPAAGSIEVGSICFGPALQRSPAATEAMFLMMQWAFDAGYRRYEWKCNALNLPSRRAAERFGFSYEGLFRQATIAKGRNRDTAWFAVIDKDWPALRDAYQTWLVPGNFDGSGQQRQSLARLTHPLLVTRDPVLQRAP